MESCLSLAHVHRFSAAGMQLLAALGMTAAYVHEQKSGFSTFELDLTRFGTAAVGDVVDVRTWVSHLGNSSLRIVHRMTAGEGREIATLVQSGVHLDMEARRSTAIPEELRSQDQNAPRPRRLACYFTVSTVTGNRAAISSTSIRWKTLKR